MFKKFALLGALLFVLILSVGAVPLEAAPDAKNLRLGFGEPTTLDPALMSFSSEAGIGSQIYEGLTGLDQNLNLVPAVASSWSASPDAKTWTFTLRSDVLFHNGRPVVAGDFVLSWKRAKGSGGPYAGVFQSIKSFKAPNDTTLVVKLKTANATFPLQATLPIFSVIPKEAAATIATHPVGTGPFKFVSWTPNTSIVLKVNKNYYDTLPQLKQVTYVFFTSFDQEWAAFQANQIHVTRIPTTQWNAVKNNPNTISSSYMHTRGIGFKPASYSDVKVRKAFQRAINRAAIVGNSTVWPYAPGITLARGIVSPGKSGYDNSDVKFPFNPNQSLSLLASAGWTDTNGDRILDNGAGTKLSVVLPDSTTPSFRAIYQSIGNDLKNIGGSGVGADVRYSFDTNMQTVLLIGWTSDYPDPENDLLPYQSNGLYAARMGYSSPAYDALLKTARATLDAAERNQVFHEADARLVEKEAMVVPLYYGAITPIMRRSNVNNFVVQANGYEATQLKYVTIN